MKHFLFMLAWFFYVALGASSSAEMASEQYDNSVFVSADEAKKTISNVIVHLQKSYVDSKSAQPAIDEFNSMLKLGKFNKGIDFYELKTLVESTLLKATKDSGFELVYHHIGGELSEISGYHSRASMLMRSENVGRLVLDGDYELSDKYIEFIESAFVRYENVDALVIDIRHADYASVEFIQKLLGYFLVPDSKIIDVKLAGQTQTLKPIATTGMKPLAEDFPVYIATSAFVSGPWELFAYTLQQRNRAKIVGELTMGVGFIDNKVKVSDKIYLSLTQGVYLPEGASASSSSSRSIANLSDGWNEYGVTPDFPTKAKRAFDKAFELAMGHVK